MSENGETVYLSSGDGDSLTGYRDRERFGAAETGISFGRYQKSTGTYNFVAMVQDTPGRSNSYPLVGPVVINEIMYHPTGDADAEYVELLNISDQPVVLAGTDPMDPAPWRFTDDPDNPGIEFLFPLHPPLTLLPGDTILLVKDITTFTDAFPSVPETTTVFAWGSGRLANGREKIQLSKPGEQNNQGRRHWIRVDRVTYSDGQRGEDFSTDIDPWPLEADGLGASLTRINPHIYGNDPVNWEAAPPSPGR